MKKLILFPLSILIFISFNAFGEESFDQSINRLESRLTDIVKSFDEKGQVVVFAKEKKETENLKLPSLPFLITGIKDEDKSLKLASLEVNVFSRLDSLPPEIESSMMRLAKEYYNNPKIKISKVTSFKEAQEDPYAQLKSYLPYILGTIGGLAFLFLVVYIRRGTQLKQVLETQFSMLAQSFSENSGGGASNAVAVAAPDNSSGKSSIEINTSASSQWEEYSARALISVLTDCYWCHDDEYASYVWKKINIAKRNEVLDSGKVAKDYVAYLSNVDGVDKGYIDEPYYLDPLPIEHLSNEELLAVVKEKGSFIKKLSKLRANNLPLKAKERLQIYNNIDETQTVDSSMLESLDASSQRVLQEKVNFRFSSIEEENEVVSLEDMSYENMRQFPSLAWLTKISKEEAVDILGSYTAKQLANVWIGPESVLEELAELIPSKKRDLLNSYLQTIVPSREHPIYEEIINLALDTILEENRGKEDSSTNKAA